MKNVCKVSVVFIICLVNNSFSLIAQDEPLDLYLSAGTRWNGATFFQGAPIYITVSLINADIRREEENARDQWREEAEQAVKEETEIPPYPVEIDVPPNMLIKVSDDNLEWFSRVTLEFERVQPTSAIIFDGIQWTDQIVFPETVQDGEILLGQFPIWATIVISPEMSSDMSPGVYRVDADFPDAKSGTAMITVKTAETSEEIAILNYELAEYALRQEQYDDAIEYAQQATGNLPFDNDLIHLTLGDAFLGKGELEKAIDTYEMFLNTYEDSERWGYPEFVRHKVEELKRSIK